MSATVRTKSASYMMSAGHCGTQAQRRSQPWGTPPSRQFRPKMISDVVRPHGSTEAMLPPGGAVSEEFTTRLAVWLASVAMNDEGAS